MFHVASRDGKNPAGSISCTTVLGIWLMRETRIQSFSNEEILPQDLDGLAERKAKVQEMEAAIGMKEEDGN